MREDPTDHLTCAFIPNKFDLALGPALLPASLIARWGADPEHVNAGRGHNLDSTQDWSHEFHFLLR